VGFLEITGGVFKGRKIKTVDDSRTRYTPSLVRKAIFDVFDVEGATFADVFAGSGIVGFEALSRGAKSTTMVDISKRAVKAILQNAEALGVKERIKVMQMDFRKALEALRHDPPDFMFLDPPFNGGYVEEILKLVQLHPPFNTALILEASKHESKRISKPPSAEIRRYGDIWLWIFYREDESSASLFCT